MTINLFLSLLSQDRETGQQKRSDQVLWEEARRFSGWWGLWDLRRVAGRRGRGRVGWGRTGPDAILVGKARRSTPNRRVCERVARRGTGLGHFISELQKGTRAPVWLACFPTPCNSGPLSDLQRYPQRLSVPASSLQCCTALNYARLGVGMTY